MASVRAVYRSVAERAGLVFCGLVMKTGSAWRSSCCRLGMTTDAQQIDLVLLQQALIHRTVRGVTSCASFDLRLMLVNERTLFFRVAFIADLVPCRVRPELLGTKRSVRAMAIIALD